MKKALEESIEVPYTVVGHSSMGDGSLHILFTAEGLKAISDKIKEGDLVRYETWSDISDRGKTQRHYSEWTIIRKD